MLEIVYKNPSDLIPYVNNAKVHEPEQISQISASIKEFGFNNPILLDGDNGIIAGHGRLAAAAKIGMDSVPTIELSHLSDNQKKSYVLADNRLAEVHTSWDLDLLSLELESLEAEGENIELTGFDSSFIIKQIEEGLTDEDEVPDLPDDPVTVLGDIWLMGDHRVMAGDSTVLTDLERLMDGRIVGMLHADPPYGMGKEKDGVKNDNIYGEDLDAFQMEWWTTARIFLRNNANAYIWGNSKELWRLWFKGGLSDSERLTLRNQIVWDKKNIAGMKSPLLRSYAVTTEHCLFFMLGAQDNTDAVNYWEGWEPIRTWMDSQRKDSGLTSDDCNRICGKTNMYQAAFTKGGFRLIQEEDYQKLREATDGKYFKREYSELKREYSELKREYSEHLAYFDNAHEVMRDVWEYPRVHGADRHGHATPKPVEMMKRVMISSLEKGGLCYEPFGGSGSTLMGAEVTDRKCYTMELDPKYCDVIVTRWQEYTGKQATLEGDGRTFDEIKSERV